jgi:hypothetical protein
MIPLNINPATKDTFEMTCQRCSDGITKMQTEKIIRHMVRMPASLQTLNLATSHVYNNCNHATGTNWNQSSDRNLAHIQKVIVPSRGNSTKQTLTRARPGACSAGGVGGDVKHGSYDRYLARLKGKSCNPVKKSTDVQTLTSTFEFAVGDFCWTLAAEQPDGPFYKAVIDALPGITNGYKYVVRFFLGYGLLTTEVYRNKSELLIYLCRC